MSGRNDHSLTQITTNMHLFMVVTVSIYSRVVVSDRSIVGRSVVGSVRGRGSITMRGRSDHSLTHVTAHMHLFMVVTVSISGRVIVSGRSIVGRSIVGSVGGRSVVGRGSIAMSGRNDHSLTQITTNMHL